jgi:hypothetical protein
MTIGRLLWLDCLDIILKQVLQRSHAPYGYRALDILSQIIKKQED